MSKFSRELSQLREDYQRSALDEHEVGDNPFLFFEKWFHQALQTESSDANAMVLSTVSTDGFPDSRVVLLKAVEDYRFIFYTNFNSQKGIDLQSNPRAALLFHWKSLERQVRIVGEVTKVPDEISAIYFHSRPKGSQIGALTSPQSQEIADRNWLEERYKTLEKEYQDKEVPKPEHWGGYALLPHRFEFWQGRSSRLHDRIVFSKTNIENNWRIYRVAP